MLASLSGRERDRDRKRVCPCVCPFMHVVADGEPRMASRGAGGNLWLSQGDNEACVFLSNKEKVEMLLKQASLCFPQARREGGREGCYVSFYYISPAQLALLAECYFT